MKLRSIDKDNWQEFLVKNSDGSLFHTWMWQDVLEKGFGVKVDRLGIFAGEQLVGILPLVRRKMSLLKLAGSPLSGVATPHSGPLGNLPMKGFLEALDSYAKSEGIDYLELGLPSGGEEAILKENGFVVEELLTLDLEITPDEEALWANLEVRCRNAVRKAEKSGVEVFEAKNLEDWLEPYYELSKSVYERQGKETPFSKEYFRALWENFYQSGDLLVLMARYEEKIIAGAIFPRDREVAYYLDGVSDREYNKVVPNNLIQWEFLKRASKSGLKLYDMVGANIPTIAKFKQSFGSVERKYLYVYKNCTLAAKVGRSVYSKYGAQIKKFLR